jgi:hypothetical protein
MNAAARVAILLLAATAAVASTGAGREAVLNQVDLPHSYYWRELYLPQLTTGPSSVDFFPDGQTLAYSMGGSLWWQRVDEDTAYEMTHAPGAYDYQPDVAPDGNSTVFVRYDGKAMELWRFDAEAEETRPLTNNGGVNVEPRLSPDGKRLIWVSTQGTGHFNLFIADIDAKGLHNARLLLGERKSEIDRYYYSAFDHAVNPSWSPDGETIYFVGNPEIAWGTGDILAVSARNPSQAWRVLAEETSWSARPELAPDGKRLLYSSYRGQQSHQLWLSSRDGAAPLPLTFGDSERRHARWSPDGRRIAYIGNAHGNTELVLMDVVGGASRVIAPAKRQYLEAHSTLVLDIVDAAGQRVPARVSVQGSDGRAHAPDSAWMHADDGFDRALQASETHYFHCASPCRLSLPVGEARVTVQRGFAHAIAERRPRVVDGREVSERIELQPNALPAEFGDWISADLHVHMNYGGHYRNTPANLARQAQAEDLDMVWNLIVNKEQRIPDIAHFRGDADPANAADATVLHSQEYHTSLWGHLGLLGLRDHYLTPDFASYRHTALASPYPHNGAVADLAHAQGALVGYVHPFDWPIVPAQEKSLTNALPADVIAGKVDYLEIVSFADHKATAEVWYRLLNLGFRLPAGAGTDAMANYASLRGPVGMNRIFLDTGGRRDAASALQAIKQGRGFVSNAPLLGLKLGDAKPGDTLPVGGELAFRVAMRSPVPVDHLELVQNGRVLKTFELGGDRRRFDGEGRIALEQGGWILLRAWNDAADPQVLDLYPYATTNPIHLQHPDGAPAAREDAAYFVAWMDRVIAAAQARDDYNTAEERRDTLDYLQTAREAYRAKAASGEETP